MNIQKLGLYKRRYRIGTFSGGAKIPKQPKPSRRASKALIYSCIKDGRLNGPETAFGSLLPPCHPGWRARRWALGPRLNVASAATADDDDVKNSIKSFTKAYNLVEENFADPVSADKAIYNGAIPGMLRTLDPHSNFFDPRTFALMREDQRGNYYGVGMKVGQRSGKTLIYEPFKGSPAFNAGLRPGDVIVAVNDKPTDNLTSTEVADMLKGPRGTQVKISVQREGTPSSHRFQRDPRRHRPRQRARSQSMLKSGI